MSALDFRSSALAGLLAALVSNSVAGTEPPATPSTPDAARMTARKELDAMHALLLDGHPGAIDDENPDYRQRIEKNYLTALARVKDVKNQYDAMSVADSYADEFQDAHLRRGNGVNRGDSTVMNGWAARRASDGSIRIAAVAPDWPTPLPPLGAQLLACDGRSPGQIFEEDVVPFSPLASKEQREFSTLMGLTLPRMSILELNSCTFRLESGQSKAFAQHYQHMDAAGVRALLPAWRPTGRAQETRSNDMELLADGTLWIRAQLFQLDAKGETQLGALLTCLEAASHARRIVFDLRGNSGGSSTVGARIFDAATGGLVYDQAGVEALPRTRAWWRVSPTTLEAQDFRIEYSRKSLGEVNPLTRQLVAFRELMQRALERGEHWLPQDGGQPLLRPEELSRRHAHLARFTGQVVLLTDSACVSACLDMADLVRSVPGALHVGETTAFDSVYIEVGGVSLPSGNKLMLPLKVWRNRLRANDQPWVPQVPITVSGRDDALVRSDVLAAADRAWNLTATPRSDKTGQ